jgi:hypothetical protein
MILESNTAVILVTKQSREIMTIRSYVLERWQLFSAKNRAPFGSQFQVTLSRSEDNEELTGLGYLRPEDIRRCK